MLIAINFFLKTEEERQKRGREKDRQKRERQKDRQKRERQKDRQKRLLKRMKFVTVKEKQR